MASTQKRLHRSAFLREVKEAFPELRTPINQEYGLLNLEVHVFRDFTQAAIDREDRTTARKCLLLAERFFALGNSNLRTALAVSFVEDLDLSGHRLWAWECLSSELKEAYVSLCGKPPV